MKLTLSERSAAFNAIVDAIKRDAILQREVKSWVYGAGTRKDVELEPSTRTRPWVRITPVPGSTQFGDTCGRLTTSLDILVEMSLTDPWYQDAMDLWGAFERAVLDPANDLRFRAAAIVSVLPSLTKVTVVRDDKSGWAEGILHLDLFY